MKLPALNWMFALAAGMALAGSNLPAQVPASLLDDKVYNFGLIPLGTEVRHTFLLKNAGKTAMKVTRVTTSCDCTKVASYPNRIPPGGQGEIVAIMHHRHTGLTDVSIDVQVEAPQPGLYTFRLIGVLAEKAAVSESSPLFVPAGQAVPLLKEPVPPLLIDLRPADLYAQAHAAGALNMKPVDLQMLQKPKGDSILIFGTGAANSTLLARIDRLKQRGIRDVRIVSGGLRAWQLAGGPMEGSAAAASSTVALISPLDFYVEQKSGNNWLVVMTDKTPVGASIPSAYPIRTIPWSSGSSAFVKSLATAVAAEGPQGRVLISNTLGSGYDQIEATLRAAKVNLPVYYLQGGNQVYTTYSQQQTLGLAPKTLTLVSSDAFLTSSRTRGQTIRGGGCGSCGH